MILGKVQGKGRSMLVVGLSGENVTRLAAAEPILKQLDAAGFPGLDLVILYGRTEEVLGRDLETLVDSLERWRGGIGND